MATDNNISTMTVVAGADLSAKQYHAVRLNSSALLVQAVLGTLAVGILQTKPTSGQAGTVAFAGVSKAKAGGTIPAGVYVASNANGELIDAAEAVTNTSDAGASGDALIGSNVIGISLAAAVVGDVFPVLITQSGAIPTTAA